MRVGYAGFVGVVAALSLACGDVGSAGGTGPPINANADAAPDTAPDTATPQPEVEPSDADTSTPPDGASTTNAPPVGPALVLAPTVGTVETLFSCTTTTPATDPDSDPLTETLSWVVSGHDNGGPSPASVKAVNLEGDAAAGPVVVGDRLVCKVTVSDGEAEVVSLSNEAEIVAPAAAPEVAIEAPDGADGAVGCALVDAGGVTGELTWWWQVGDEDPVSGTSDSLAAEEVDHCDLVTCWATGVDPIDGAELTSNQAEALLPVGPDCDDLDPCTDEICRGDGGCSWQTNTGPSCEDGDECTELDTCDAGFCAGTQLDPDDLIDCTVDSCDSTDGVINAPDDVLCAAPGLCESVTCDVTQGCLSATVADCCGNGILDGAEACDPAEIGGPACTDTCELLGGSDWIEVAPAFTHANAVRLGADHIAVAYTPGFDRTSSNTSVEIVIIERAGATLTVNDPNIFAIDVLPANSDQGLQLMGALGPNHFFMIATAPGYVRSIHWFRRDGTAVTALGSQAFANDAFFMGHPVDATRYLLRYRSNNSGQPVHYRVIERSGDLFFFGDDIERFGPSSFPGQTQNEPQTFSPLVRMGPSTFREMRAGYVWPISHMSSWQLDIAPDGTLSKSDPQEHPSSSNKTMNPYVVGDGLGAALVVYGEYQGQYHQAYLDPDTGAFVEMGVLGPGSVTIHAEGPESTDGHFDGAFYVRVQGGELYRFDTYDTPGVVHEIGLPWNVCYRSPSIIKSGPLGVFMVCEVDIPLRIYAEAL